MDNIVVASKSSQGVSELSWGNIKLDGAQVVKLPVAPSQVASATQSGQNLVITLNSGEQITLGNFFAVDAAGEQSELVLQGQDGALWQAQYSSTFNGFTYTELSSLDDLLVVAAAGGSAMPEWMLVALSLVGVGATTAVVANNNKDDGNDDDPADTTAPGVPTGLLLGADGVTLSGKGEAGTTVTVRDAQGNIIGTGTVDANGNFQLTLNTPQKNGESIEVTLTDGAGNVSGPVTVTAPDTTAPAAPTDLAVNDDGTILTGRGEPGTTVTIKNADGVVLGSAVVGQDGNFSVTLNPPQTDGQTLGASQSDAAGNQSPVATTVAPDGTEVPDTTAPDAPTNLALTDSGTRLFGNGEAGTTVTVKDAQGNVIGTAVVAADGTFQLTLNPAQTSGAQLQVTLTDAAGNVSPATEYTAGDTTAPDAPTDLAISANGSVLTGKGEPGATVSVTDPAGNVVGTGTVGADGYFSLVLNPAQANGQALEVSLTDAGGNSASVAITAPDIEAPASPTELALDASGLTLTGKAEPGSTVTVKDASGAVIGTAVTAADGTFSITLNSPQLDGQLLDVTATDAAGNVSVPAAFEVADTTAPGAVSNLLISADGLTLSGKGEPGATVEIRNAANEVIGTGVVAANGTFIISLDPAATEGEVFTAVQSDAAGNASAPASITAPDADGPGTPGNLQLSSDGVTLTGTGTPGNTINVLDADGNVIATGVVAADGTFSIDLSPALTNGERLEVVAIDGNGEQSVPTALTAGDTTPPAAVTDAAINANGTVLTGKGEVGATVEVRDAQGNLIGSGVVGLNGAFTISLNPAQANGQNLEVTQADAAGNVSAPAAVTAPDVTPGADLSDVAINANGTLVTGKGEAGATITITGANGAVLATGTVDSDGTFTLTLNTPQTNGEALRVGQVDAGGNASPSVGLVAPDLDAPAAPAALALNGDGLLLSGTAEPGSTVTVKDAQGNVLGTAVAGADGSFQVTLNAAQTNGQALQVTATDAAGHTSLPAAYTAADTTAPGPVTGLLISADGLTLTGKGEPGATVVVRDADGNSLGSTVVAANDNFIITLNPAVTEGDVLNAMQTDPAGNASPAASITAPDADGPGTPGDLALSSDGLQFTGTGRAGDTITVRDADGKVLGSGVVGSDGTFNITLTEARTNGETLEVTATDSQGEASVPVPYVAADSTAPGAVDELAISANGSTLTGTGEAGATVTVRDPAGNVLGSATVGADGTFVVSLAPAQANGQNLAVTQADAAGNASAPAAVAAPDITPPTSLADIALNANGTVVTGKGEAGASITITGPGGVVLASGVVASDGTFAFTLSSPQTNGEALRVSQVDNAGNASPSVALVAPDLDAPTAPAGLALSGAGLVLSGTAEAGSTVTVRDAMGNVLGSGRAGADGTFQVTLKPAQINGEVLQVTATDAAGHTSLPAGYTAADTTPPAAVTALQVSADGLTVTGKGEAGATVVIRDAGGAVLGDAVVATNGSFIISLNTAVNQGAVLTAVQTDAAGNPSPSASVTAPSADGPGTPGNLALSSDGLQFSGTGKVGDTVTVRDASGNVLGSGTVGSDGTFSFTLSAPQTNGQALEVTATDGNQGTSVPVPYVAADTTAPAVLYDLAIGANGRTLSGTGEAGATVTVRDPAGTIVGTATVGANGTFVLALSPAQANGETLTATQADAAGNQSAPATVTAPDITPGVNLSDVVINANGTAVTGKGEAGATINITGPDGAVLATGQVAGDGTFSFTLSTAQTNGEALRVAQVDTGGNPSPTVGVVAPDLDAPNAPAGLALNGTGLVLSGTAEAGSTVTVKDAAGTVLGTVKAGADGTFQVTLGTAQTNGQALQVTATDAAGHTSLPTGYTAADTTPPAALTALQISADGLTLTGKGEAGATVVIRDAGGAALGDAVVAPNGSFIIALNSAVSQGAVVTAVQTDLAGNPSPSASVTAPSADGPGTPGNLLLASDGLQFSGTGKAGDTITVRDANGNVLGSGPVASNGTFSITLTAAQTNGQTLEVSATDSNQGTSVPVPYTAADSTAPDALANLAVSANGSVLTGTGEAGATVIVLGANGVEVGRGTVGTDGTFALSLSPSQLNGQLLEATQTDKAGNISAPAGANAPDIAPPDALSAVAISNDGVTVTGRGEPGASVTVRDATGATIGSGSVGTDGNFSVTLATPQKNGEQLSVLQADPPGNLSPAVPLSAPDISAPTAASDLSLNPAGTLLYGQGEPGSTVKVIDANGAQIGTITVGDNGRFEVPLNPAQNNGQALQVTLTDSTGNVSAPAPIDAQDTSAPGTPQDVVINGTGTSISGTGEAGATVTVTDASNTVVGQATVQPNGSFTVDLTTTQTNGGQLTVSQADGDGNRSPTVTLPAPDITAPDAPSGIALDSDGKVLTGTTEAGATVTIVDATGAIIGTPVADANGNFSFTLPTAQTNGETLQVTATDTAGNTSAIADFTSPDTTPPAQVSNVAITPTGDKVSGTGEAGTDVTITDADGNVLGTGAVGSGGTFIVDLDTPVPAGSTVTVVTKDAAGNESTPTTVPGPDGTEPVTPTNLAVSADGWQLTGSCTAGATITVTNAAGEVLGEGVGSSTGTFRIFMRFAQFNGQNLIVTASEGGENSVPAQVDAGDTSAPDAVTDLALSSNGLSLTGKGEIGATVTVTNATGTVLGTATVAANGTFAITLNTAQTNAQVLTINQADGAGNVSVPATVTAKDLVAPDAPAALSLNGVGTVLSGKGEAGATVTIKDAAGAVIGTGLVDQSGNFQITLTTPQTNGGQLQVTQADAAGNVSSAAPVTVLDTSAPTGVTNALVSRDGLTLTGQGEPGASVRVTNSAGAVLGEGTVASNGSFSITLAPAQADGQALSVTQADAAGNVSPVVPVTAQDTTAPVALANVLISNDGSTITGNGEIGSTVKVFDAGGTLLGSAVVGSSGQFSVSLTPAQINVQLLAVSQTDAAGNVSPQVSVTAPDLTPPAAPDGLALNAAGLVLTGKAEAGSTVKVLDATGNTLGTAIATANGTFQVTLGSAQINSEKLQVIATDVAGNASVATDYTAADKTPPAQLSNLAVSADGAQLAGTGEVGATVTILGSDNTTVLGTVVIGSTGNFIVSLSPAAAAGAVLTASQADAAGNVSPVSSVTTPAADGPGTPKSVDVSDDGLSVTGTGTAGNTITVRDSANNVLGTVTVNGDGTFTVPLNAPQTNGEVLVVTATNGSGAASLPVEAIAADTTPPDLLTDLVLSTNGLMVTGKGEVGATVTITGLDNSPLGTAIVGSNGSFTVNLNAAQINGQALKAVQTDVAGNPSDYAIVVAKDSTPPAAAANLVQLSATVLTGTGEAGTTVTVKNAAGDTIGTGQVALNGTFEITLSPAQADGQALGVTLTDAAGNGSPVTSLKAIDITPPAVLTDVKISNDGLTVTGKGEAGATVKVFNAANQQLGTTTVSEAGTFTLTLNPAQTGGEALTATQTDAGNNVSPAFPITAPDALPPDNLANVAISNNGAVVTGTGEPGATVTVKDALGVALGTAIVDANGNFTVTLSTPQVNNEVLTVVQADPPGNVGLPEQVTAPDLTPPAAPANALLNSSGTELTGTGEVGATVKVYIGGVKTGADVTVAADGTFKVILPAQLDGQQLAITLTDAAGNVSASTLLTAADTTPPAQVVGSLDSTGTVFSGSAEANAKVTLVNTAGDTVGTGVAGADGSVSIILDTVQSNGEVINVIAQDARGNPSTPLVITAPDLQVPLAPVANSQSADGKVLIGTAEANATVIVKNAQGVEIGRGTADANGVFNVSLSTAQHNGELLTVTQTDRGGNVSPASIYTALDDTRPDPVTGLKVNGDGTLLTGLGEANATVTVTAPSGEKWTGTVLADGTFSIALTTPQLNGESLSVVQKDAAALTSTPVTQAAPDLTPPAIPQITSLSIAGALVGTAEAGSKVVITNAAGEVLGQVNVVPENGTFSVTLSPAPHNGEPLEIVATDAAGNPSAVFDFNAPDNTPPAQVTSLAISPDGATLTGKGEVGATVVVTYGANASTPVTVDANGNFTVALNPAATQGQALGVVQTDAATNPSQAVTFNVPLDPPPAAPVNPVLAANGLEISGTAGANTIIIVRDAAGVEIGRGTASNTGAFDFNLNTAQTNGETLSVTATSPLNGQVSIPATLVAPDTTPPAQLLDAVINATGTHVTGHGEAGATVTIRNAGGTSLGTAVVSANGLYSVVLTPAQNNGGNLSAIQADAKGNASTSVPLVAPDIVAPDAPTTLAVSGAGLVLTGRGEVAATVVVRDSAGTIISVGTTVIGNDGTFSVTLSSPQLNGQNLSVTLVDAAGNVSAPAAFGAQDTTPPAAMTNVLLNSNGTIVTGKGEVGATITVTGPTGALGTATVDASGNFSVNLSSAQLNGQALVVSQADAAGNASANANLIARDTTAPDAPAALGINAGGTTVTGSGENGAKVTVLAPDGSTVGTGTVANGTFTVTLNPAQADGQALKVTLTDAAGNVSAAVPLTAPDITAPAVPTITISANGGTLTGTGAPGATFKIVNATGTTLASGTVAANGTFSATLATALINKEVLSVTLTDAAGNESTAASVTAPDLTAPLLPTGVFAADGSSLTVTGEVGTTVSVKSAAGVELATGQIGVNGTFVANFSPAQDNAQVLTVTLRDTAGNLSPVATLTAPDVDVNAPVNATDNLATATVSIVPVTTSSSYDDTIATLLLGASKTFTFSVAANTTTDPTLTLTSANILAVNLLNSIGFVLQVKDASGNWVTLGTGTSGNLIDITLLSNGRGLVADLGTLQAGDYRVTVGTGLIAVGTVLNTNFQFETTSLTQFNGVAGAAVTGNVITDAGTGGSGADQLGADNLAVLQVLKNGSYVAAGTTASGGTVVQGLYGTLTIDAQGNYSYKPNGSLGSVGKVESFSYQLVHPVNGKSDTATLYVRIDSPQAAEVWNDNSLGSNATLVDATNDVTSSALTLVNLETTSTTNFASFNSPLIGTVTKPFDFTVASGTTSDLTFSVTASGLSLLSPISVALYMKVNGVYTLVNNYPSGSLLSLGNNTLGVTIQDKPAGDYQVRITAGGLLNVTAISTSLTAVATHTNQFVVGSATVATGNLLTDTAGGGADVLGSQYTSLSVLSAGAFVVPGYNGVTIAGTYGSLLVHADGSYTYTLNANQPSSIVGKEDSFTYQLNHPSGATDTAQLVVDLNDASTVTTTSLARVASVETDTSHDTSVAATGSEHLIDGTSGNDVLDGAQGGSLTFEGHAGNDQIVIYDQQFASIDGGAGVDTVKWNGGDADIDLSNLASRINNIEIIDLNTTSKVNLTLSLEDLLSVTDASTDKLLIQGDSHDTVHMTGSWTAGPVQVDNGVQYNVYTPEGDESHHLWVQNGISVV